MLLTKQLAKCAGHLCRVVVQLAPGEADDPEAQRRQTMKGPARTFTSGPGMRCRRQRARNLDSSSLRV
jgi:hypothetical protein